MAETGDNNKLSDAERRALMFHHLSAVQIAQSGVNKAIEERKRVRKLAKVDGIVLSDIDFMMRCAEIEDPTIITGQIRSMTQIAEWFALPVQYQPDMFVDRAPALERIEAEGEVAGLSGKTGTSEYTAGSPEDQAWMKGWTRGQKSLADDLVTAMDKRKNTISQDNDPGFDAKTEGQSEDDENQEAAE